MASAADDFLTARVINVPVKLLFNFQVLEKVNFPFACIGEEVGRLTTIFF